MRFSCNRNEGGICSGLGFGFGFYFGVVVAGAFISVYCARLLLVMLLLVLALLFWSFQVVRFSSLAKIHTLV